jgi:hypothetical protein
LGTVFPRVTGSNLNGKTVELPKELKGKLNIVVIAFIRGQGAQIAEWVPSLNDLVKSNSDLAWYELPTLSATYLPSRPSIDGGMRAAILENDSRERTITLYLGKKEFMQSLNIPHEDTIYILLINKSGQVIWRAENGFTEQKFNNLKETVKENI